ncbi:glycoside hydrolase family 32 protein [Metabacillus sediminilitoris]|uniref:Glycoside hydrolase family 32 protein n=1 Tax=Metabacillus sediminilitoris TaxID=2567941 RepID=A0A4S4BSU2_9BACI|nr:glycoside hydrolase family 32 protein [Metabacillus sediminilitoris]THF78131.1 glycoside hydrolase family 32 protein [Metabacillus sediminilitoris]
MNKKTCNKKWVKSLSFILIGLSLIIVIGFLINQINKSTNKKEENPPSKEEDSTPENNEYSYRAQYHFTVPDKWKNDPQRPIYIDGRYHYYYLYNRDYPNGNGTEWRHATSKDLLHWNDEGVAIPKYTNKNGDPWSGSVVIDKENTAGFGKGAFIAIVTQPSADGGKQEQFLWYSKDKGKTFTSFSDKPIMLNPGTYDFRDPKIIWDNRNHKWVMVMAEGSKIGFYESHNLKNWHYMSSFATEKIGILECPDLYLMRANDGTLKWVLGVSANGKSIDQPNTYAYWTGYFDGKEFNPDQNEPQWLDYGFDWYGGVTFEDGKESDKYKKRYAFAWMNNWAYAHNTPTLQEDFNGMDSIVRQIELRHEGNNLYYLASQPIEAVNQLTTSIDSFKQIEVNGSETLAVKGDVYQLEADISWTEIKNAGLRLRESTNQESHVDVGIFVDPLQQYSYVNRLMAGHPDESNQNVESKAQFDGSKQQVHLKILVDKSSIEVFVDDGRIAHSNLIFPAAYDQGITLFSEGGTAIFNNIEIKHLESTK